MDRVLGTTELLELILLQLDYQTLLGTSLRVCRTWNDTITSSPRIQRLLFFREDRTSPDVNNAPYPHQQARQNPLIDGRLTAFLDNAAATKDSLRLPQHMLHKGGRVARAEASWHDMFVQQPPPRHIGVWKMEMGHYLTHGYGMKVEYLPNDDREGFRMRSLVDFARESARQGYRCAIFSGGEGRDQLNRYRNSLLVTKAPVADRQQIYSMIDKSDLVFHLVKCPV